MTATHFSWWYNRKKLHKKECLKVSDKELNEKFKEVFGE